RRVLGHHGLGLEDVLGGSARALAARVELRGCGRDRSGDRLLLFVGRARRGSVGRRLEGRRHERDGTLGDALSDSFAVDLGHVDYSASASVSSIVASWSSTPSASSPSTVSVTWSPVFAPSEMTPRMLAALTGAPSPLAIVTVWPEFLAASENSFAGRACRPWEDAMVTVRVAMVFPFVGGAAGADPSEGVLNERERPRAIAIARDVGGERHDGDPARGREGEDVACR